MYKKILVPLDGSENAEKVLPVVEFEAKVHDASVVLLRVIAPLRQSLMASPNAINRAFQGIEEIAKDYLEEIAESLREEGVNTKTSIRHGYPAQWTLDTAQEQDCDLIIIGTHGETGSQQWRFGGVANKVVKAKSGIAILVIPTNLPE
jgi:nucleotide-binding universal stress UspA family protein